MMGATAVLLIILAVLAFVGTLWGIIGTSVSLNDKAAWRGFSILCGILMLVLVGSASLFGSAYYRNHFYGLYEAYETSQANVGIMEFKADALEDDLTTLLNIYIGHEGSLIDVVGERDIEELRLLFERYPQLQASGNVQQVTSEFITLVEDIVTAKLVVNAVARAYNTSQRVIPASWFAPEDLPGSLSLLSLEE